MPILDAIEACAGNGPDRPAGRGAHTAEPPARFSDRRGPSGRETGPILGIGDYNFDFDFPTRQGNAAFDEFLVDDVWRWVEPETLVDTNWSDRDEDGLDNYPDSCLDFMFVAGKARGWESKSRVIVGDGDFPDDDTTSDHRPVELVTVTR